MQKINAFLIIHFLDGRFRYMCVTYNSFKHFKSAINYISKYPDVSYVELKDYTYAKCKK